MTDEIFEIRSPDGTRYELFEDGTITGFAPGSVVLNRYPRLVAQAVSRASLCPTSNVTLEAEGHGG